jgi:hypothetical protein
MFALRVVGGGAYFYECRVSLGEVVRYAEGFLGQAVFLI